jgi:hypothetical protein
MKKLSAENMASTCSIYETSPDELRMIADRLDQQRIDCALPGQVVLYSPDPSTVWIYKPERVALSQNASPTMES